MNPMNFSILAAAFLLGQTIALAESEDSGSKINHRAEALQITTDAASNYEFELVADQPKPLVFHSESILRWSNPIAGEVFGSVYVWTHDGRPEVIGSLHQWYTPLTHGAHEFHSLASVPVRGERDGKLVWKSQEPGIDLRTLPAQQPVAESKLGRLRQMRAISREFTVEKTDREDVTRGLRLLSQPIFRYPGGSERVLDGTVFVFVQGTDPEVFLLVEARRVADNWQWQYAFARMNSVQFVAKHRNRQVWSTETWSWSKTKNGIEPYTQFGPFQRPNAIE